MPNKPLCSASVINPLVLITTAQCASRIQAGDIAVTGDYQRSTEDGTEQERTVSRIIIHEKYDQKSYDSDIALVVLEEPLQFDDFTRIIEIPRRKLSRKRKFSLLVHLAMQKITT